MRGLVHEGFWHDVLDQQMQDNVVENKGIVVLVADQGANAALAVVEGNFDPGAPLENEALCCTCC